VVGGAVDTGIVTEKGSGCKVRVEPDLTPMSGGLVRPGPMIRRPLSAHDAGEVAASSSHIERVPSASIISTPSTQTRVPSGHVNARPTEMGVAPGSVYVQAAPSSVPTAPKAGVKRPEADPAGVEDVDVADTASSLC
jgi:hypothetical protein